MAAPAPKHAHSKPLSVVATRIVQEALRNDVELSALARLAEADPGFAARIVSTVNSSAFGMSRKVSEVRQACSLLGVRGLRNLALSLVVSDMVPTGDDGNVLLANSLRRAVAARLLAEAIGERPLDEYFTAGLFLEIGLLQSARADLAGAAEIARMPSAHRVTIERASGRVDHTVSGTDLARTLGLHEALVEAVGAHHAQKPLPTAIGRVTWAAERVAGVFEGAGDVERAKKDAHDAMQAINIAPAAAAKVLEQIPGLVAEAAAAFDREVPGQENLDALVADANRRLVEMNHNYERILHQLEQLLAEKDELTAQLRRANEELANVAATDALTELPNRRAFQEALKRDLSRAERTQQPIALLMVDVDFFKKVNDTYGHATGDVVLKKVAEVVRAGLRTGDVPARLGGEEFVALLSNADAAGGQIVAERLRVALATMPMPGPSGAFNVTASFGVASCAGAGCRGAETTLLERADAALYEAKRTGRNRVVIAK